MSKRSSKTKRNNSSNSGNSNKNTNSNVVIALRFRDKACDDTIEEHKKIITAKGKVWWGWWAKNYEVVNADIFNKINSLTSSGSSAICYLINVNKAKFYEAKCSSIQYLNDGSFINCPEKECSPEYYNNSVGIKAWFCLKSIKEITDEEFLGKFSFFNTSEHIYVDRSDCVSLQQDNRADSVEVFAMQNTSIWFLRVRLPSDKSVPKATIKAWKDAKMSKTNFPKNFFRSKANKILLLSDLHFGNHHLFDKDQTGRIRSLYDAITKIYDGDKKNSICALIVSGEFVWIPCQEEFDKAYNFLKDLMLYFSLNVEQVMIVPGNHDLRFSDKSDVTVNDKVEITGIQSRLEYQMFYKKVYGTINSEEPAHCLCRRVMNANLYPIEIIGLDSNILQQKEDNFIGQGFIGLEQLDLVQREMELKKNELHHSYRILVLHHHLLPAFFQDELNTNKVYSTLLDYGRLAKFIKEYRVDLVIHGHHHDGSITEITYKKELDKPDDYDHSFGVVAVGSAGVKDENTINSIGEIEFRNDGSIEYVRKRISVSDEDNGEIIGRYKLK